MVYLWQLMSSLIEIYDHFQARSAKPFMNIYGSFMIIFDPEKREAQKQRTFISH